ncbi:hypothetical protein HNQ94_002878 [Salirhabdus euzebyi]|uniref:Uncharacterized protein n=1 Tax=Salirhabdus euzebyi TaxID=394506 RepID=A0A841Q7L9_9BACI|nr:hypothetical protein [Salirhabdus euzebyi]MBB6454396.1 hypothetical protein [Salirhabdus euzebyi]
MGNFKQKTIIVNDGIVVTIHFDEKYQLVPSEIVLETIISELNEYKYYLKVFDELDTKNKPK